MDDADIFEDALPEEVVFDTPAECATTFIEDFNYAAHQHFLKSDVDKFYPPSYGENRLAHFETKDDATPPQPPPPRQRIGGGRKPSFLHTALLTTFFFSAFMAYFEECDATVVGAQMPQPFASEDATFFAAPPAQGLVVPQHPFHLYDDFTVDFYEDPGPEDFEIDFNDKTAIRIRAFRALRGEIESEMLTDRFEYVAG